MDLIAKLPVVAATIYNNLYRDGAAPCPIDGDKDWSYNFIEMIGHKDPMFTELMRLYLQSTVTTREVTSLPMPLTWWDRLCPTPTSPSAPGCAASPGLSTPSRTRRSSSSSKRLSKAWAWMLPMTK